MFRFILASFFIISLSNCVATQSFPNVARAGDTVTLAVGSTDGLNKTNITVEFYPDGDPLNPVDITTNVRSVMRLYPDKTSKGYWDETTGSGLETMTYLSQLSLHGPWQSVVALDLPTTLPIGSGVIKIQFGAGVSTPPTTTSATNVDIALEILPSIGSSSTFEYRKLAINSDTNLGDLSLLEQTRQVVVRTVFPDFLFGVATDIAAAEYTLTVPIVDQLGTDVTNLLANEDFVVVLDDQPSLVKSQANLIWTRTGSVFKVIVVSPFGNLNANQVRFSVLLSNLPLAETNDWKLSDSPILDLVKYYDVSGNEVTRTLPQILVQN